MWAVTDGIKLIRFGRDSNLMRMNPHGEHERRSADMSDPLSESQNSREALRNTELLPAPSHCGGTSFLFFPFLSNWRLQHNVNLRVNVGLWFGVLTFQRSH